MSCPRVFLAGYRNDQLWDFLELGNGGLFIYNVISQSPLEVTGCVFQVLEFLTSQQLASYFSRKKNRKPQPKVDSPPQAVCSTCVKYQLNFKTKEHLLQ